ncbi:MAG: hypothetical protein JWN41_1656, partial [Thermoleophilia bacterium]|nr:hypothetical protein [Thermoleophilia bacterium]
PEEWSRAMFFVVILCQFLADLDQLEPLDFQPTLLDAADDFTGEAPLGAAGLDHEKLAFN